MSFASLWLASTSIARRYIARRGASQWGGWAYPPIGVTVPCGRGTRAFSLKHNRDHLGQGEIFLRQHRRDRSASANCGHWCSVASRLQRTHKRTLELRTYRAQGLYFLGLVEDLNGMSPSGLMVVRPRFLRFLPSPISPTEGNHGSPGQHLADIAGLDQPAAGESAQHPTRTCSVMAATASGVSSAAG